MKHVKRLLAIIMALLICSFVFTGCKDNKPIIKAEIRVNKITDEDYKKLFNATEPEGIAKSDIKKLDIDVKILNSNKAEERTIIIPNLSIILDRHDRTKLITLRGGSSERHSANVEESSQFVYFNMNGLSEQDLRTLYSKSDVLVKYKFENSKPVENKIQIGENMVFEN